MPAPIAAVGDLSFYGRVPATLDAVGIDTFCREARADLAGAVLRFANFEVPLAERPQNDDFSLMGPLSAAPVVAALGLNVVNVANNHIMDAGPECFRATLAAIHAAGVMTTGAGETLSEARRPAVVGADGLKIGVLGYAEGNPSLHHHLATDSRPGAAPIDLELIRADVTALRQAVDRVVVSLHWGVNYIPYAMPQQRELARTLLALGVDAILGTHPHVISGVEWIEGKPVAYSLGDFVCDPTIGNVVLPERIRARRETAVLQLDPAGAHTWIPYRADESCQPHRLTGAAAAEALAELQRRDARYSDGSYPADPWAAAGETIGGHALQVLWFHLKRGNIGYLSQRFLRIRPRHLRMLRGLLLRSR